jgi:hypothetical protein
LEVCPCIQMSVRGRLQLVDHLEELENSKKGIIQDEETYTLGTDLTEQRLWHQCFLKYRSSTISIKVVPVLKANGDIWCHTQYDVFYYTRYESKSSEIKLLRDMPINCCPHRTLGYILSFLSINSHSRICFCLGPVTGFMVTKKAEYRHYSVKVERNLGNGRSLFSDAWRTRPMSHYYYDINKMYWADTPL